MTVTASRTLVKKPVLRCELCCRPVKDDAKRIPLVGVVGDTCYHRVAALTETLEKLDLKRFLDGPIQFTPVESEDADGISMWVWPMQIEHVKRRAEKLGFSFEWDWPRTDGPATCWLTLPRNNERRRKLWGRLERAQRMVA